MLVVEVAIVVEDSIVQEMMETGIELGNSEMRQYSEIVFVGLSDFGGANIPCEF